MYLILFGEEKNRYDIDRSPSLSTRATPLPQLPHQYKWDQNQLWSSCCKKNDIKFIQTPICAQAEFLPLHYPQLQEAGSLGRRLCHETAWPGPTFMNEIAGFFPNVRSETMDECHLFFTKPLGERARCISSIQCWYIWFPSRTDQTLNNIEQAERVAKILAMKSFHSQLIS